ncbi:PAS domain-containing sensor histidine kinase [Hyphomicrobium sp. D-2]|uniref:sensor histidine kinase NtrY-like n=1 Tax=Hyphomicrobium sp. D-2 TaxID=3041621 RepID=UPI0024548957|nr:PAS domain-containing sensor histidine kinase [Hyphomicrobium sp. D-2]MDH4981637.1 PAS domain-containing sensor histidine kinase [Hyphomicrobium sp. D-2]
MSAAEVASQRGQRLEEGPSSLNPGNRAFWIGFSIVLLSLVSALATYLILTDLTPIRARNDVVLVVLAINVLLIISMIALLTWQVAGLAKAWKRRIPGARLHIRIVALFSVIAALPTLLLALGATITFSRSLDGWFASSTRAIVASSADVANAYLDEHGQVIRTDIVNMARDLDMAAASVAGDPVRLQRLVMVQAGLRDLPAAYIIDGNGRPVVETAVDSRLPYVSPPQSAMEQAYEGQVALLMPSARSYRVGAVTRLERYPGNYLYVMQGVNPQVIEHLKLTAQNADQFNRLRKARGGLKIAHGLMYLMISMTAMLAAIWAGLWFAGRFVAPIRRLIGAAQEVSTGNLNVELPEKRGEGDLRRLSQTFNTMTRELKTQRDALVTANEQLVERRHFMEAVLSGVSAGVIGLDSQDRITLVSRAACELLGAGDGSELVGQKLRDALPVFGDVLDRQDTLRQRSQEEIHHMVNGDERTFAVMVTRERASDGDVGSVVTFDDVTDLVVAQRTAAWADVARRIAHEIKNPLTPIQLAAERLRRKYSKTIENDRETFDRLTMTIERQVADLKTMVDEFAEFARMPKPEMASSDLRQSVQEPVVLFREAHRDIEYVLVLPEKPLHMSIDRRLITRAVTNLVKNASEAVESQRDAALKDDPEWKGRIETILSVLPDRVTIEVIDNGTGLPKQNRGRLTEPYVTTKGHKGTGLGLAMVQKITEQHGGALSMEDAPPAPGRPQGAHVRITLPLPEGQGANIDTRSEQSITPAARAAAHEARFLT